MRRIGGARMPDARGGHRGRGHRQRAKNRPSRIRSTLVSWLQEMWAFGLMAATTVQKVAAKCVADHSDENGPTSPQDLVALAEIGASGASPQHAHENLANNVRKAHGAPDPLTFKQEMLSLKRRNGQQVVCI